MSFGQLLKDARKRKAKTLREVSQAAGLSLSYLSDIERGRKKAPAKEIIEKIEIYLDIADKSLQKAAKNETDYRAEAKNFIKKRPELSMALLRATDGLSEEDVNFLIDNMHLVFERKGRQ